ncbi:hypothetical protein FRC10_003452 [Ceratobasidium sp. 414]|nr:hypothetical protein FRC10_003452 [Ceratobasidium sp. 414]
MIFDSKSDVKDSQFPPMNSGSNGSQAYGLRQSTSIHRQPSGNQLIPSTSSRSTPQLSPRTQLIGRVQGEVHVTSGDGVPRMVVIVAESKEDSVKLQVVKLVSGPAFEIFAASTESSVHISMPSTFQGPVCMSTNEGRVHISDGVKSRLTTFSSSGRSMRGYLGDTRGLDFGKGAAPTSTSPSPFMSGNQDLLKNWTGPLANLSSVEGSVHIPLVEENKNKKTSGESVSDVFDVTSTVLGIL